MGFFTATGKAPDIWTNSSLPFQKRGIPPESHLPQSVFQRFAQKTIGVQARRRASSKPRILMNPRLKPSHPAIS
jgi:hypothetical protein